MPLWCCRATAAAALSVNEHGCAKPMRASDEMALAPVFLRLSDDSNLRRAVMIKDATTIAVDLAKDTTCYRTG